MKEFLNEEIHRILDLMNVKKLVIYEQFVDDFAEMFVKNFADTSSEIISKELDDVIKLKNVKNTSGQQIKTWGEVSTTAKNLGKRIDEVVPGLTDDLIDFFSKNQNREIKLSFYLKLTNSVFPEGMRVQYQLWQKGKLATKDVTKLTSDMKTLVDGISNPKLKSILEETPIMKNVNKALIPKVPTTTASNLSELEISAQKKMRENFSVFRSEFKKSFDFVVSNKGENWETILGPEGIRNTEDALNLLESSFPNRKFRFGNGRQELTIEEIRTKIKNYKGLKGPNGEWSSVNFLDTNSLDSTEFFMSQAKKILSVDEYDTLIKGFANKTITKDDKIFRKVLSGIESDTKLWDDMIKSPSNFLKNIPKTVAAGSEGEQVAKKWFTKMGDVKILWEATIGSPIDRLLGIDFILDVAGETSTANVKRITGTINRQKNINNVLGNSYKIWSRYGVQFSKQSNLSYGILVDGSGNFIMFKKQPGIDWELKTRTSVKAFPSSKGGYFYVDDVEGVRVYFN